MCTNPPDAVEHKDPVVLRRFTTQYAAAGFDRFFDITYDLPTSADWHPLVCFIAKPEAYTVPAAEACMKLNTAVLVNQNVGSFVAIFDLRELVMQPIKVMLLLSRWMKAYAELIDWKLVAASVILTGGIKGYMTRAAAHTVMTVVPTTAKFNICFALPEAMEFLDSLETSSSPGGPARKTHEKLRLLSCKNGVRMASRAGVGPPLQTDESNDGSSSGKSTADPGWDHPDDCSTFSI
ncbi:unnamed protein product [Polarella glacialis]|uniref:Uncharacterized protein n=1 Tax=Polarella glacialis TaxID=89957 RepID=A0A813ET84_POLGL|nr:unnamed protein product [Polarella glacialis]